MNAARSGQIMLEYLIAFAVVGLLTIIGFTSYHDDVRKIVQGFFGGTADYVAGQSISQNQK